jgi:uncharacterized protein with HEPN domain
MQKHDAVRIHHILDAAREAETFIIDKTRKALDHDRKLEFALIRCIEIIGEAAANISKESRDELPQIPWTEIISMRNRLIHGYFEINLDILWETVVKDLPPLISVLEKHVRPAKQNMKNCS